MALRTTSLFNVGNTPGIPRQTGQVFSLGFAPNLVEQEQKSFDLVESWT
jgi:hypothetical protein